ncbi:MAG: RNA-binding [Beijerinckiaceae bacterium]|nr:MAG: RNA-binding [Beijerinckiaceae bacterium]
MGKRGGKAEPETVVGAQTLRLDKWIWFARFQRSRETCADLVRKGHVRVNSRKVTQPGAMVRPGDVLTLALPGKTVVIEITGLAGRREGAALAAGLYRSVENDAHQGAKND